MESRATGGRDFPITDWVLVEQAGHEETEGWSQALGELVNRYQPHLKRYLIERCRCAEDKAQDLLQGFLLEVVLKNKLIRHAQPRRGHLFRSFLLRALSNYVVSQFRKEHSQKRQPPVGLESLDELIERGELAVAEAWSASFDIAWARSVVAEALARMRSECAAAGQSAIWGVFDCRLRGPILDGLLPTPYQELVRRFGFPSAVQAQNALTTAKRKFCRILREIVREYTPDDTAVEIEVRELQLILGNSACHPESSSECPAPDL